MNNLTLRAITAFAGAAVFIAALLWNEYSYCLLFLTLSVVLQYEFLQTAKHLQGYNFSRGALILNILIGICIHILIAGTVFFGMEGILMILIFPMIAVLFIAELFRSTPNPFIQIGAHVTALLYIVLPVALLYIVGGSGGLFRGNLVLAFMFFVWTSDTMAYFIGRAIGRHKLYERISPNKTWEGFIGGLLSCVAMAFLVDLFGTGLPVSHLIIMGVIVSITGTLGDLIESMFKRSIQIKDSGSILPGHGGFLDRFDAFLISAPFVFVYLVLSGAL